MAFLDPSQFSLGTEPDMRSFQDRMLELRRGLPPAIAAQQPPIPGMPQQTRPEQRQQDIAGQINQAAQMLSQKAASESQTPNGKPDKKAGQTVMDEMNGLLDQVNPLKPKQSIGSPTIGKFLTGEDRGGLYGTGIQPIDVLAFAFGAAATSRLPQDKAMQRTFEIAQLPGQLRDSQLKNAQTFIQSKLQALNAGTQMANAETAQAKAAQAQQQYQSGLQLANAYRLAGRHGDALAIEAGAVDEHVKLSGGAGVDKLPPHLEAALDNILANPNAPVPDWAARAVGASTPEEARQSIFRWRTQMLGSRQPIPTPSGGALVLTPGGPVPIEEAPTLPGAGAMQRMQQPVMGAPQAPVIGQPQIARPDPRLDVRSGAPRPSTATAAPSFLDQLSQSSNKQDKWVANYAGTLPEQTGAKLQNLFRKPMTADTRQRLIAQQSAFEYGKKLSNDYEAMVKSYGGDAQFTLKPRLTLYLMSLGTRISGEGVSGSALAVAADAAEYLAQQYGVELTPEAHDFIGSFAQAQSFARGAMNDAANLATRERTMFNQMIGTPLNKPSVFRSRISQFTDRIGHEYNNTLKANEVFNVEGWEPIPMRGKQESQRQPQSRIIPTPGGQLPSGWEFVQPTPQVRGEY